jgi:hypothetical protein
LEREFVTSVRTTIDNVESRGRKDVRGFDGSKLCKVLVKGDTLLGGGSFCNCDTDTEDRVGTKFSLIWGSVEFDEEVIDILLGSYFETRIDECWANGVIDVRYCLRNTYGLDEEKCI